MPRRMGRPGLVGTMARTAVIAGTATAVSGNVQRRQMGRAQAEQAQAEQEAQQAAAVQDSQAQLAAMQAQMAQLQAQQAPPAPAAGGGDDLMAKLQQLADLKAQGILSDDEFTAAKAKLLS